MKRLALLSSLLCFSALASDTTDRHQVSIGRSGLGWSASVETMDTNRKSSFGSVTRLFTDLGINYAYRLGRFQVGGYYQGSNDEYKFKKRGGGFSPTQIEVETYGLFAVYNFSDDLTRAWFAGVSVGLHKYTEENSHDFEDAEGKSAFELDDSGAVYELLMGKRFSLEHWEIKHITYAQIGRAHV